MSFSSVTADSNCVNTGFNAGDRVVTKYNAWALQGGSEQPAYGRVTAKVPDGSYEVEFDMGAEGKLSLPIPDWSLEHETRIPTLAENQARLREKQRAIIEADGAQAARIEREIRAMIMGDLESRDQLKRETAFAWGKMILGKEWEPQPDRDGQANTAGIRRDFEAAGLDGILNNVRPMIAAMAPTLPDKDELREAARRMAANARAMADLFEGLQW